MSFKNFSLGLNAPNKKLFAHRDAAPLADTPAATKSEKKQAQGASPLSSAPAVRPDHKAAGVKVAPEP